MSDQTLQELLAWSANFIAKTNFWHFISHLRQLSTAWQLQVNNVVPIIKAKPDHEIIMKEKSGEEDMVPVNEGC
jgi:hypothetical protein